MAQALRDFQLTDRLDEVSTWYNGYVFGQSVIYNPWSVMSFIAKAPNPPGPQWINTSANVFQMHNSLLASLCLLVLHLRKSVLPV